MLYRFLIDCSICASSDFSGFGLLFSFASKLLEAFAEAFYSEYPGKDDYKQNSSDIWSDQSQRTAGDNQALLYQRSAGLAKTGADHVDRCLVTFYASPVWEQLRGTKPGDFLEIERFSNFTLDGVPVTVKLDCATREEAEALIGADPFKRAGVYESVSVRAFKQAFPRQ